MTEITTKPFSERLGRFGYRYLIFFAVAVTSAGVLDDPDYGIGALFVLGTAGMIGHFLWHLYHSIERIRISGGRLETETFAGLSTSIPLTEIRAVQEENSALSLALESGETLPLGELEPGPASELATALLAAVDLEHVPESWFAPMFLRQGDLHVQGIEAPDDLRCLECGTQYPSRLYFAGPDGLELPACIECQDRRRPELLPPIPPPDLG